MSNNLKPCPFCGEKEDIDYGIYNGTLKGFDYVQCQTCGATINAIHKDEYIAAEKLWNTRTDERPKGEWIKHYNNDVDGTYYCSCCGKTIDIATGEETPLDRELYFCPNCGADMRKEKGNG